MELAKENHIRVFRESLEARSFNRTTNNDRHIEAGKEETR